MSGSHAAKHNATRSSRSSGSSGSKWKVVLLVVLLLAVVAVLGVLLWTVFGSDLMARFGGGSNTADIAPGITTQINAEYSNGRNVAKNIAVTQGTQRPEDIAPEDQVVLLDISWTGKKEMSEPLYITVSDPSFTDGDGLAVHHYNSAGQWDLIGTYTISNHAVTFLADSLSPFAFQVISSQPAALSTPEASPTPLPTATPEPTPEPTPAPVKAVDYGTYTGVQTGVFTLASELEDDATYVLALVQNLPDEAVPADTEAAEDTTEDQDDSEGGLTISYVNAPEESAEPAADTQAAAEPETPTANVLVNLDGQSMTLVEMPLVQDENGTWCLGGPVTDGMVWTSNRDAYKDERRFSLKNNDRYLNLDDNDQNVILNDNHTRTRWKTETITRADGTQATVLDYRNDSRFYVNQMSIVSEALPGGAAVAAAPAADGTTPVASSTGPVYLGVEAPADTTAFREYLQFTVSTDEGQSLLLLPFKLDAELTAPEGVATTLEHNIVIPAIDENTNLSTLAIRDGDTYLQLGKDYTVNARVYNESVVVVIQFIGNYTGEIVRTYPGTTIITNEMTLTTPSPVPTATAIPSPSPTPYTGGEGTSAPADPTGGNTGGTTGGNTGGAPEQVVPVTDPPAAPASGTNTGGESAGGVDDPVGDPSDTNA